MAANPVLIFGAVAGLLWGLASYFRGRGLRRSMLHALAVGLALGTPLHFLLVPGYAGWVANQQIYRRLKRNWTSFIVSLVGVPVFFGLLQATGKIMAESYSSGSMSGGEVIVVALGWGLILAVLILAGCALYVATSLAASLRRRGAEANH